MSTWRLMTPMGGHPGTIEAPDAATATALAGDDGYEVIDVMDDILVISDEDEARGGDPEGNGYVRLYCPQHGPCVACGGRIHVASVARAGEAWVHDDRAREVSHHAVPHDDRSLS